MVTQREIKSGQKDLWEKKEDEFGREKKKLAFDKKRCKSFNRRRASLKPGRVPRFQETDHKKATVRRIQRDSQT